MRSLDEYSYSPKLSMFAELVWESVGLYSRPGLHVLPPGRGVAGRGPLLLLLSHLINYFCNTRKNVVRINNIHYSEIQLPITSLLCTTNFKMLEGK